jgi:hypothetical protein
LQEAMTRERHYTGLSDIGTRAGAFQGASQYVPGTGCTNLMERNVAGSRVHQQPSAGIYRPSVVKRPPEHVKSKIHHHRRPPPHYGPYPRCHIPPWPLGIGKAEWHSRQCLGCLKWRRLLTDKAWNKNGIGCDSLTGQ